MAKELKLSPVGLYRPGVAWSTRAGSPMYRGNVTAFNLAQERCNRENAAFEHEPWVVLPLYPDDNDED